MNPQSNMPSADEINAMIELRKSKAVNEIYDILADASEGTVDPTRAFDLAHKVVEEACDNREGK